MNAWLLVQHCSLLALLIVAAYTDLSRGKVYNWCTYPAIVLGLGLGHILDAYGRGHPHLLNSLVGFAIAVVVFGPPYALRQISAGDLKLIAAVGAIAGAKLGGQWFIMFAVAYSVVVAGAIGLGVLIWRGMLWEGLKASALFAVSPKRWRRGGGRPEGVEAGEADTAADSILELTLPYGFAVAAGTMLARFNFLRWGLLDGSHR